jgi:GT2 family glycosyltransferase
MPSAMVGIVTVTFNSADVLPDFLNSILKQQYANFKLFVVDNASTDDTLEMSSLKTDARIEVIANDTNVGVAQANNQGIFRCLESGCDCILLINNDTVFDSTLLSSLVNEMERMRVDMITPKILYFDRPDTVWCAGGAFVLSRGYSGVHFGLNEKDAPQWNRPRLVEYAPTCCILLKSNVFRAIGVMDARYFVYFDDTDFCWRAKQAGVRFGYTPFATLYHKVGSLTGGETSRFFVQYSSRNHALFLLKNLSSLAAYFLVFAYFVKLAWGWMAGKYAWQGLRFRWRAVKEGIKIHWTTKSKAIAGSRGVR